MVVRHELRAGLVRLPGEERCELLPHALEPFRHRPLDADRHAGPPVR
ncbi:hypothetical protein [Streptomyces sp. MK7]